MGFPEIGWDQFKESRSYPMPNGLSDIALQQRYTSDFYNFFITTALH